MHKLLESVGCNPAKAMQAMVHLAAEELTEDERRRWAPVLESFKARLPLPTDFDDLHLWWIMEDLYRALVGDLPLLQVINPAEEGKRSHRIASDTVVAWWYCYLEKPWPFAGYYASTGRDFRTLSMMIRLVAV